MKKVPVVLRMNGQIRNIGSVDIASDWTFTGWMASSVADILDLDKNLGSVALNPVQEYVAKDDSGVLDSLNEFHNDQTIAKVREALAKVLYAPGDRADEDDVINALQNAGILFRERR